MPTSSKPALRTTLARAVVLLVVLPVVQSLGAQSAVAAPERPLLAPLSDGADLALPPVDPALPSPADFLGYPLGERFTRHDRILAYLDALAASSPRLRGADYGTTYEGRPLRLYALSSPANLGRLEAIREAHQRLASGRASAAERDRLLGSTPPIVWLAFGVHGNETSSPETAMALAYLLCGAGDANTRLLDDLVILVDPSVNPDGHERYVEFFESTRGAAADAEPAAAEHAEPWPGGRENHYLIDLNRDWAWATQRETRARLAALRAWEPQVYVDFHEMGTNPPTYFFPPPAEPVLDAIDRRVLPWLQAFGRGNAAAFDRHAWPYFARQVYDLFYPGYGDTYPGLRGAVGMTYEVSGGGKAGSALRTNAGALRLADRIARHLTTALATLDTADRNRGPLLSDWANGLDAAGSAPGRTVLWNADQPEARALAELLTAHGVRVQELAGGEELRLRPLAGGEESRRTPAAGTFATTTAQPMGALVKALLEPGAPVPEAFVRAQRERLEENRDTEFYDITAWSLPLAFNLQALSMDGAPSSLRAASPARVGLTGTGDLGYLVPPQGLASYKVSAALLARGLRFRVLLDAVRNGSQEYPSGTLYVPRQGEDASGLDRAVAETLAGAGAIGERVGSGYAERGILLGSRSTLPVKRPRVALLRGNGIEATQFGALWHLLDRELALPHTVVDLASLERFGLARFSVLILPSGDGYEAALGERGAQQIDAWVKSGGVLIAIGDAVRWTQKHSLTSVRAWEPPKREDIEGPSGESAGRAAALGNAVADRSIDVPGAVVATNLRKSALLAAGIATSPPVLVNGSLVLEPTGDPQIDVLTAIERQPVIAGFAWPEAKTRLEGTLLVASQARGTGRVILFGQDPAFRLFWRGTMPLFLNAVLYEPSVHGDPE